MQTERFHTLDALRGIAAIAVMLFHAGWQAPLVLQRGYLAADLFFVLSGFVLAHSYEARLRGGMTLWHFIQARLQRIYPLYWLGAFTGCLLFAGSPLMILMIPTEPSDGLLFRANAPLWSLLFELVANIAWALLAVRLRLSALGLLLAVFAALLFPAVIMHGGADLGAVWPTALAGLARTFFSFTLGVVLLRLYQRADRTRRTTPLAWLLLPALILVLAPATTDAALADIATLAVALPLLVWLGARCQVTMPQVAQRLGGLSFPLYCMHAPFVAMGHASPLLMGLICTAMVLLALLLDRFYDAPIQRWLRSRAQSACPAPQALA